MPNKNNFGLGDLFGNAQNQETMNDLFGDRSQDYIIDIPIDQLDDFGDHTFKVVEDDNYNALKDSIRENGQMEPAIVRKKNGRYEMVVGHRRKHILSSLGNNTMKCIVKKLDDEQASLLMLESNLKHRSKLLPSEKIRSYYMLSEIRRKRAGRKAEINCDQLGPNSPEPADLGRSSDLMAKELGESPTQLKRILKMHSLVPQILNLLDDGKLKMTPCYELSFLSPEMQEKALVILSSNPDALTMDKAVTLHRLYDSGKLESLSDISSVLSGTKVMKRPSASSFSKEIKAEIPSSVKRTEKEAFVLRSVRAYAKASEQIPKDIEAGRHEEIIVEALKEYFERHQGEEL